VVAGEDRAPAFKDRLLGGFSVWSGREPERLARGEPVLFRIVAPLAVLIIVAAAGAGLGYGLARQADDALEAGRRQALAAAVELLQTGSRAGVEPTLIPVIERMSGVSGLRFDAEPAPDDGSVQPVTDRNGRIAGWFAWKAERPATAMMTNRVLPFVGLIVLGLIGVVALTLWRLGLLSFNLARSEQRLHKLIYEDPLTGLPNQPPVL
jgi:hypothetical protein